MKNAKELVEATRTLNDAKLIRKLVADRLYVLGAGEIIW